MADLEPAGKKKRAARQKIGERLVADKIGPATNDHHSLGGGGVDAGGVGRGARWLAVQAADGKPLYQMLVTALRTEILNGVYPIGTSLPSESTLVTRFEVSRHTVREALRQLRDLGLIESRQGVGSQVLRPGERQVYVHQVNSIADLHDRNLEARYNSQVSLVLTAGAMAERLGVAPGERWLRIDGERLRPSDKAPVCIAEIYIAARFAGVARLIDRGAAPIYSLIEAVYGESIAEVDQEVRVRPIGDPIAAKLSLSAGETVMEIRRVYRLLDGSPAEITYNYYKASSFVVSTKLRRIRD